MALTQEEVLRHQQRQNDLKMLVQILTPFTGINAGVDTELQKIAVDKIKEVIPEIQIGIPESIIKKI